MGGGEAIWVGVMEHWEMRGKIGRGGRRWVSRRWEVGEIGGVTAQVGACEPGRRSSSHSHGNPCSVAL